jgi:hypothetical protein
LICTRSSSKIKGEFAGIDPLDCVPYPRREGKTTVAFSPACIMDIANSNPVMVNP